MNKKLVYNFDRHDKFYMNSCMADNDPINNEPLLPAYATFIPPPQTCPADKIPIFNELLQKWEIVDDNFWHPKYEEINFYTGNDTIGIPQLPVIKSYLLSKYPDIPRLLAIGAFGIHFESRINALNIRIENIFKKHNELFENQIILAPEIIAWYKTEIELIIHLIKKSVDEIITLTYIKNNYKKVVDEHIIKITKVGQLFSKSDSLIDNIKCDLNFNKHEKFFEVINDIHNSIKHDIFLSETYALIGESFPTICILCVKNGSLEKLYYHNHSLGQIVIGFSEFLNDIFLNKLFSNHSTTPNKT